jgi:uncharacterized tellurite resistance protein B-like protein
MDAVLDTVIAMAIRDRILPLTDLLLGAAYADKELKDQERDEVRAQLEELAGELTTDIELHISKFDPAAFDLTATCAVFADDSEDDRKKLLHLVSAVIESDDELDLSEDDYLRALAAALKLPASALAGLTVDVESEELQETFQQVRKGPPPLPKSKQSFDIDVD